MHFFLILIRSPRISFGYAFYLLRNSRPREYLCVCNNFDCNGIKILPLELFAMGPVQLSGPCRVAETVLGAFCWYSLEKGKTQTSLDCLESGVSNFSSFVFWDWPDLMSSEFHSCKSSSLSTIVSPDNHESTATGKERKTLRA